MLDVEYFAKFLRDNKLGTDANVQQVFSENVYPRGRDVYWENNQFVGNANSRKTPYPARFKPTLVGALRMALDCSWGYNKSMEEEFNNVFRFYNVQRQVFVADRAVKIDREAQTVDFTDLVGLANGARTQMT